MRVRFLTLAGAAALSACSNMGPVQSAASDAAPAAEQSAVPLSAMTAEQIVQAMSVERKVAQLVMPDISTITPDDVRTYRFGSILNGGNSGPGGNDLAPAPEWLALADAVWEASSAPLANGEPAVPALWATDAVHGHSNIPGATIFPHNIALGATRDAELMERIGKATAAEIAATGIDWTFAPTLAVATDDRWGRTYESFSEDPQLVSKLGESTIWGLQGRPGSDDFLDQTRVIATAKHFYGDGGTGGIDRGNTAGSDEFLRSVHLAPYKPAIGAAAQTVMASFSSVNGEKMHGSKRLLTDVLRGELGFGGLVVGDWNGHGELDGCTNTDCPQSLMAGLDIFMVPEDWKGLYQSLLSQVNDGTIPMERLDEAVIRILKVKQNYGLFSKPKPSERSLGADYSVIGADAHRAVAREAVRKSLVLLKNNGVLPLKPNAEIEVAGAGADSIAIQSGGWSITWQGGGELTNSDFPGATSIFAGLAQAMAEAGGNARLASDSAAGAKPDAAIVVFGEEPYAEFVGDREDLAFRDEEGLELLREYKERGIPTVAVFLSGRPLWVNREMALSDAFVAAWLPGSEGGGIADVLVGNPDGSPRHDFTGKLAFGWPSNCAPTSGNLFNFGDGGSYAAAPALPALDLECALLNQDFSNGLRIFERGLNQAITASAADSGGQADLTNLVGKSPANAVTVAAFDKDAQEDARRITWNAPGTVVFDWKQQALPEAGALNLTYKVDARPTGQLLLTPQCEGCDEAIDLTSTVALAANLGWRTMQIPLSCLSDGELAGFTLESSSAYEFEMEIAGIVPQANDQKCTGPF